jgi:hypothetical protein
MDLHDQTNSFHSTDLIVVWLIDRNEAESRIAATFMIWLGQQPKEMVARCVTNAGSSLLETPLKKEWHI